MDGASDPRTGLYWGRIVHRRFRPKPHFFTYPVFIFAMDLDEISKWDEKSKLFAHNRFALYSLRDSDHGGGPNRSIRESVTALLRERGYAGPVERILMVTQFRVLGYLFNPVTFYYCYAGGEEVAFVAEVNNTFRQRHSYVFFGGGREFRAEKVFYVSPFLEMDLTYAFRFAPLGPKLGVFVDDYEGTGDQERVVLKTHIAGAYRPLTEWELLKSFVRIPFMSAWIIGWIHWQALRLWLKKVRSVYRPPDGMKPGFIPAPGEGVP